MLRVGPRPRALGSRPVRIPNLLRRTSSRRVTVALVSISLVFGSAVVAGPGAGAAVTGVLPTNRAAWSTVTGTDGRVYIADELGRARQFHGSNHKTTDPDTLTDDLLAAAAERGLDHIRLAIFWDAIEPTQGNYDTAYLDKVVAALDRAEAHGVSVILDMHQDVYGPAFGSRGIPEWATRTDGVPFTPQATWLLNYLEPAVQNAFDHLYEDADLRQAQLDVWMQVVNRVKDHPAVFGYDLMNEPFGKFREGEPFLEAAARVEREQLTPMYQRLTDAISAVDATHWVFYEAPNVASLGIPTSLGKVNGPKVAFYPHMYDAAIEQATYTPGGVISYDPVFFSTWANALKPYLEANPVPMLVGEWGIAEPEAGGMDQFVRDTLRTLDAMTSGWSQFNFCKGTGYCPIDASGNDRAGIGRIFQPYARAIAGAPTSTSWDPDTAVLQVVYRDNSASGPTQIFVPESRSYPGGWTVLTSDGPGSFTQSFDAATGVVSVNVAKTGGDHAICVVPTGSTTTCAVPVSAAPEPVAAQPVSASPAFTG